MHMSKAPFQINISDGTFYPILMLFYIATLLKVWVAKSCRVIKIFGFFFLGFVVDR